MDPTGSLDALRGMKRPESFGCVVFRFFYLFAHRGENLPDRALAKMIGDKRRDEAARICVNGIGHARLVSAIRLEQPCALAYFDSNHAFLLCGAEFVCRLPIVRIGKSGSSGPRRFPYPQRVIAIAADLG